MLKSLSCFIVARFQGYAKRRAADDFVSQSRRSAAPWGPRQPLNTAPSVSLKVARRSNGSFEDGTKVAKIAGSVRVPPSRNGPTSELVIHRRSEPHLYPNYVHYYISNVNLPSLMALIGTVWHGFGGPSSQKANPKHGLGQIMKRTGTVSSVARKKRSGQADWEWRHSRFKHAAGGWQPAQRAKVAHR